MPSSSNKREVANLGKIGEARLDLVPQLDECRPGIQPVEYNVVIAPARMAEKIGSIFIPDEAKENEGLAMQVGRIIAQSPLAYSYEKWPDDSHKPQVGQLVWFARYGGALFTGMDGQDYRILKDKDIGAVIVETPAIRHPEATVTVGVTSGDVMQVLEVPTDADGRPILTPLTNLRDHFAKTGT